ncbi:MAG: DUF4190 domain-containing protein [Sedimentisphaerales bacterium]
MYKKNPKQKTSYLAQTAFALGIGSLLTFGMLSPVAIVFGVVSLFLIVSSRGRLKGMLLATLGIVFAVTPVAKTYSLRLLTKPETLRSYCWSNLNSLRMAISSYSDKFDGKYPTANQWCDLLVQYTYTNKEEFICSSAGEGRCHYAINPNVEPNSSPNIVLLFETKGGWNQYGGPELLAPENHRGKGCNILFNSGSIKFVRKKEFPMLKWKPDEAQKE